ncbi:MAG: hypothetical protein U9R42_10705 [Bacteroidota bacterium]|nr:hypothetical protein [Bacteroidota bacterium]
MKALFIIILTLFLLQCTNEKTKNIINKGATYQLPKVLIVTSGSEGNGKVAEGIIVAIQSLNKNGAIVELATRDILQDEKKLKDYNFLILLTAIDYHDADMLYSLTFMSDFEINNIKNFVSNGGVLIAGDNIGRNKIDGTDRISLYGKLTPQNWGLGKCFGVSLEEKNMKDFKIEGKINNNLKGNFKTKSENDIWTLIIDSVYSQELTELAIWKNGNKQYPAIIQNNYNKGISFLFPSSYFLHPANNGGYWSASQIQSFYEYVLKEFYNKHNYKISLNPWPNGFDYAFCASFNASGKFTEYQRICNLFESEKVEAVYFVNNDTNSEIKKLLLSNKCKLQSNGFGKINYQNNLYPKSKNDILKNENAWGIKFSGFRFPYTRQGFWGLLALDELNYKYESSIGADNIEFFNGSVFPYNIPISNNQYYKITKILELSPTYHDDYYFYKSILESENYLPQEQKKDAQLFEKYLLNYWEYAVKPYNGLMIFLGHPAYVAYNDTTIQALKSLITKVKEDNTWITSLDEVADYWNKLYSMTFEIKESKNGIKIYVSATENVKIEKLTLNLFEKPKKISLKSGKHKLLQKDSGYKLLFDAFDGQMISLHY